jgi:hypothetical protein
VQTGGPAAGFEYMTVDRWTNEDLFPNRMKFDSPWIFNYMHAQLVHAEIHP